MKFKGRRIETKKEREKERKNNKIFLNTVSEIYLF
jgi:hypothetical protein